MPSNSQPNMSDGRQSEGGCSKHQHNEKHGNIMRKEQADITEAPLANLGHGKPEGSDGACVWMLQTCPFSCRGAKRMVLSCPYLLGVVLLGE